MATESLHLPAMAGSWFPGGGEMGRQIRDMDWSGTPLGPAERWPHSLRTALSICLGSKFPILLWWGPEFTMLYNDAYRPMLGSKHPGAVGQRGRECWHEIWHIIGPMLEGVRARGVATWSDDQMLPLHRRGFTEECYFTYTYSPIHDDAGSVEGVFCAVIETTERVLAARRLATLRELAGGATEARDESTACDRAIRTLAGTPEDAPFAALYVLDESGTTLQRAALADIDGTHGAWPDRLSVGAPRGALERALAAASGGGDAFQVLEAQSAGLGNLPARPWPEAVRSVACLAVARPGRPRPYGVIVVGLSPRRDLDDAYRSFLELAAGHVATAIANSRTLEEERRRARMLAELDRAKTTFFANVSHEFRTPLTLMLGPLEQVLSAEDALPAAVRQDLRPTYRNALRLLKLVNTLLDFSRIEAGRADATFEPTDLGRYTAGLASVFRSAVEDAGLRYTVDCPSLAEPAWVDRQMWEKIVFNLLSNALKFTLEGGIAVRLAAVGDRFELSVTDTGLGIAAADQARIFERFHRLTQAGARTQEGTGIGLALSQEFVRLHGGTLAVASEPGRGSVFTVSIPRGCAHLDTAQVRAHASDGAGAADRSAPYIHEALGWVGPSDSQPAVGNERPPAAGTGRLRVLVADDNGDMRGYLRRICADRWDVELHGDGASALASIQRDPPDLVLADIMMPGLDGLTLVRRVRADPALRDLPVILLSARAGEEARLEGLQAGASDYLVKPFSARELLAYVEARLEIAATRREAERGLQQSALLNAIQRDTLAMAVSGAPVASVLQALADAGRQLLGDRARTAVYTKDASDPVLHFGAASGLPDAYVRDAGMVPVGEQSLPCGRAAQTGRPVIVADLEAELPCRQYLRARGLDVRSSWSLPIRSAEGRVLGTYAVFRAEPGEPTARELERLDLLTQTAAVVLEHHASARMRETAEATLRDSEQQLNAALEIANSSRREIESLLDAAPLGVYVVDAELRIRHANPTALLSFGSDAAILGRDFRVEIARLWPPDDAAEVVALFEDTLATGESHVMPERVHVRRDLGVAEVYEWQIDRIPLADGRPGVVCYYRDVSTQVRARKALARAEALNRGQKRALELALNGGAIDAVLDVLARTGYEVFRDQAPTAIFRTGPRAHRASLVAFAGLADSYVRGFRESNLLEVSPSRRAILDGEMVVVEDVRTDANCGAYTGIAEAHGIRAVWSFPIRAPDGTVLGALTVYRLVPGPPQAEDVESMRLLGDTAGMLLERDRVVAARQAAEEALRESERRIRELADAMPQLVWTSDSSGRVDYYNGRALQYAGIRPGTTNALWQDMLHPDDAEATVAAWRRAVEGVQPYVCEHRLRMVDGSYRWHLSRAEPVRSGEAGDSDIRWFGTATDVHELRAAREALRDNEERLREADRRKDEFIAMLAHELRNPLAPIRTGLQVIQRAPGRVAEVSRLGEIMERQVTHMVRLIDDLLDVSRITSGKLVLQRQASLLQDLVAGAVDANRSSVAAGGLELVVRLPDEPLLLDVDPTRFLQVVSNLLNNAAKFTPAGGRIELSARVEGELDAAELVLAVSDTGIGIAPEMLQRVFEMFTQGEPSLQRSNAGLGIGLALARRLVEMHGGTLVACSDGPGRGSTFTLRLGLGRSHARRHVPTDAAPAAAPSCLRRVLIVDDNEDAAEALAMLVTDLGGSACTANDGRGGIERLVDFEPDIVLLDLGMPGMDGYETCRRMREGGAHAYIVALTGWGQQKDRHQVLRSGFDAHLTKPADPAQLEELLAHGRLGAVARSA